MQVEHDMSGWSATPLMVALCPDPSAIQEAEDVEMYTIEHDVMMCSGQLPNPQPTPPTSLHLTCTGFAAAVSRHTCTTGHVSCAMPHLQHACMLPMCE